MAHEQHQLCQAPVQAHGVQHPRGQRDAFFARQMGERGATPGAVAGCQAIEIVARAGCRTGPQPPRDEAEVAQPRSLNEREGRGGAAREIVPGVAHGEALLAVGCGDRRRAERVGGTG